MAARLRSQEGLRTEHSRLHTAKGVLIWVLKHQDPSWHTGHSWGRQVTCHLPNCHRRQCTKGVFKQCPEENHTQFSYLKDLGVLGQLQSWRESRTLVRVPLAPESLTPEGINSCNAPSLPRTSYSWG